MSEYFLLRRNDEVGQIYALADALGFALGYEESRLLSYDSPFSLAPA
jgi:hypothetical protein